MSKIKDVPIDEYEITFEDEITPVRIKKNYFIDVEKRTFFVLGGNEMEGRTDTTFWKDKAKMKLHIDEKLRSVGKNG